MRRQVGHRAALDSADAQPPQQPTALPMTVPSGLAVAGKVLAIVVTCAAAALSLLLAFMLLSSLLGDPSNDPHGYALVFGSLLIVPTIVGATALPFIARRDQHRARIIRLGGSIVWVVFALGLAAVALSG